MSNVPLLTIVTPCLNRSSMIIDAIESVQRQNYAPVEHIIVDGGSTDGTLEKLARYPRLKIVSGPDKGMYDALNKGLQTSSGKIIGFLNSDDFYTEGSLKAIVDEFAKADIDAVAGRAIYFLENGDHAASFFRPSRLLTKQILWREIIYGDPAFNTWFFRRGVFGKIGNFDITYRIAGDRDFLIRFAMSGLTYAHLEKVVYHYRAHNDSMTVTRDANRFSKVANENVRLVEQYFDRVPRFARPDLERVRTRDTITAASRELRVGNYQSALHYIQLGCRYDLFWPIKFLWRLFTGIFRVIGRMVGAYPPI